MKCGQKNKTDHFSEPSTDRQTRIRPKAVGGSFSAVSSKFEKCRLEVADDVISGLAVDQVSMDVHVKFGDSMLNSGQIIRLFASCARFTHFCGVLNN